MKYLKKILVVEDEYLSAMTIKIQIENQGHKVLVANDRKQAIKLFDENEDLNLVVLDLVLPPERTIQEGYKVMSHIDDSGRNVPIKFISGFQETVDQKIIQSYGGFHGFHSKPLEFVAFLKNVLCACNGEPFAIS